MRTSEGYYRGNIEVCEHCRQIELSEDDEIRDQGLCDHCYNEINDDEIIGYRKGE